MPLCPELIWRIHDFSPDLIHVHTPNPLGALALLTRSWKCPIVVEHHSDTVGRRALRLLADPCVQTVMRRSDAIIATSQRYVVTSPELRPHLGKVTVIPLGINLPQVTPETFAKAGDIRAKYGDRLIVAIGRLVPYKGFGVLIDAMREVHGTLLIIGNGPLRETLQRQIQAAGLTKQVHLLCGVPDVVPYLKAADVFGLPSVSRAEAFGIVQVEAMACGTPVVNTNVNSAVPEISLHGVTGLTVPPNNAGALASALNLLLNNDELRTTYGNAGRLRAAEHFTANLMAQRTEAVYRSLGVPGVQPQPAEAANPLSRPGYVEALRPAESPTPVANPTNQ